MWNERAFRLLFPFVVILTVALTAAAQILPSETTDSGLGGTNIIIGTIHIGNGARLERRVTVRLQTMTRGDRVTTTDEKGSFAFRGLVSGDYTVVIDKEKDFEPLSQNVSIVQVRGFPAVTQTLSLRLIPKANSQPKPGVLDVAVASLPEQGRTMFAKAQELEKANDHAGAIEQLLLLTTQFPKFMPGFNELGSQYLQLGNLDKADSAFQAAVKLEPEAFQPQLNRGMTLVMMKRYSDAEPALRNALSLNAQSGAAKYFLGTALANLGKFDEAEKQLSAALAIGGNEMVEGHRILAIIYSSKGDKKRAVAELEAYLKINPTAPDAEQLRKVMVELKGSNAQPSEIKP